VFVRSFEMVCRCGFQTGRNKGNNNKKNGKKTKKPTTIVGNRYLYNNILYTSDAKKTQADAYLLRMVYLPVAGAAVECIISL